MSLRCEAYGPGISPTCAPPTNPLISDFDPMCSPRGQGFRHGHLPGYMAEQAAKFKVVRRSVRKDRRTNFEVPALARLPACYSFSRP